MIVNDTNIFSNILAAGKIPKGSSITPWLPLTENDYQYLESSFISPNMADSAGLFRVDKVMGAEMYAKRLSADRDFSGIVFTYTRPGSPDARLQYRLRRDYPDLIEQPDGSVEEDAKYITYFGERSHLYFPPGVNASWLSDKSLPIVFVEGEKKALAMWRVAWLGATCDRPRFLPVGLAGVWNWRGRKGTSGKRVIKGPIDDLAWLSFKGREAIIFFDRNVHWNEHVRQARAQFGAYLTAWGAETFFADIPEDCGDDSINGPDDLAYYFGPEAVLEILDSKYPASVMSRSKEPRSKTERAARSADFRKALHSSEALAASILGNQTAKHLAQLYAEADLSPETRDLCFTIESLLGQDEKTDFYYSDLYPLLYKSSERDFEQKAGIKGSLNRRLKSGPRKKLSDRFARAEADFERCGIAFFDFTAGHKDFGEDKPSHVRSLARGYIAEALAMAQDDPAYSRGIKAARSRALAQLVAEKSANGYSGKKRPRLSQNKKIANALNQISGLVASTVERMERRGDSKEQIGAAILEAVIGKLPAEYADYIAEPTPLIINNIGGSDDSLPYPVEEEAESPPPRIKKEPDPVAVELWGRAVGDVEARTEAAEAHRAVADMEPKNCISTPLENAATEAISTDDFAGFSKTCKTRPVLRKGTLSQNTGPPSATVAGAPPVPCPECSHPTEMGYTDCCKACGYLFTRHYWRANYPQPPPVREKEAPL